MARKPPASLGYRGKGFGPFVIHASDYGAKPTNKLGAVGVEPAKTLGGLISNPKASNFDLLAGYGLFDEVRLVGVGLVICGVLPVSFRPFRICIHPLRSTLVWSLMVWTTLAWSACSLVVEVVPRITSPHLLQHRYNAIVAFFHGLGIVLVPVLCSEARKLNQNGHLCAALMDTYKHIARARCRHAIVVARFVLGVALLSPLGPLFFKLVLDEGSNMIQLIVHVQVTQLVVLLSGLYTGQFTCVADFARDLHLAVTQELMLVTPSAQRIAGHRHAWLMLRDLTESLVTPPHTAVCLLTFLLLVVTLTVYLCIVFVTEALLFKGLLVGVIGLAYFSLLVVMCCSAQYVVDRVGKDFQNILELYSGSSTGIYGETAMEEIKIFREVVAANRITISACGFVTFCRATVTSFVATGLGYIIVLAQFRDTKLRGEPVDTVNTSTVPS